MFYGWFHEASACPLLRPTTAGFCLKHLGKPQVLQAGATITQTTAFPAADLPPGWGFSPAGLCHWGKRILKGTVVSSVKWCLSGHLSMAMINSACSFQFIFCNFSYLPPIPALVCVVLPWVVVLFHRTENSHMRQDLPAHFLTFSRVAKPVQQIPLLPESARNCLAEWDK